MSNSVSIIRNRDLEPTWTVKQAKEAGFMRGGATDHLARLDAAYCPGRCTARDPYRRCTALHAVGARTGGLTAMC